MHKKFRLIRKTIAWDTYHMSGYSPELVESIIQYFKEEHELTISKETAELYLTSLANFYSSVCDLIAGSHRVE